MPVVSYAVDIGVYYVSAEGRITSKTATAWARSDKGPSSFEGITYAGSLDEDHFPIRSADMELWAAHQPTGR